MPGYSPDAQGWKALKKAQKEEMDALSDAGAVARKSLKGRQTRAIEQYVDTTREAALVYNVLRKANEDEYKNLPMTESKKTFNQKGFVGKNFSGKLGDHDVEIFTDGGYNRTLKIDGILIHSQRKVDNGPGIVVKPSADEAIVNEFFDKFDNIRNDLLKEKEERADIKFAPETMPETFPEKFGEKLPSPPKKMG